MPSSRLVDRAAALLRRAAPLLAILAALGLTACGDDDDDGGPLGPGSDVIGTWQGAEVDEYVRITTDEIDLYVSLGDCYAHFTYEIVDVDGDVFTIEIEGLQGEIEIRRDGADLVIDGGEPTVYEESNVDLTGLTICDDLSGPEDFDPTLATCTSYDPITLGVTDGGTLSAADPSDPNGYYFDAYRLQLDAETEVQLDLVSDEIDSYLYLYSSTGTLLQADDDGGDEPFASRIVRSLSAGCYIVVASSYDTGEVGAYVIDANAL